MEGKTLARIGAIAFVAVAITATAVEMTRKEEGAAEAVAPAVRSVTVDPLRADLARCQRLGEAAARDTACLATWAENRRRFLGLDPITASRPAGER